MHKTFLVFFVYVNVVRVCASELQFEVASLGKEQREPLCRVQKNLRQCGVTLQGEREKGGSKDGGPHTNTVT